MPTREEVEAARRRRIGLAPARVDQQQQPVGFQKPPTEPTPLPVAEKPTRGGLKGFVRRITTPLVDVPELPGGFLGDIVEEGIESVSSPVGLLSTALIPITGGASLGLRGALGVGAKIATRAGAEVVAGGAGGLAAREVNERLPEGTPGALRIPATLGAAVLAGGGTGLAAGRLLGGGKAAAKAAAATPEAAAVQSLGGYSPAADEVIAKLAEAKAKLKDPNVMRALRAEQQVVRTRKVSESISAAQGEGLYGIERHAAARAAQRGAEPKLDFPELGVTPETINELIEEAMTTGRIADNEIYKRGNVVEALERALIDRTAPTKYESQLLEQVFGPAFARSLTKEQPFVKEVLSGIVNLPRAILATMDLSFPMNQGLIVAGADSKMWAKSFGVAGKAFADPAYQREIDDLVHGVAGTVKQRKVAELAARADLHLTGKGATRDDLFATSDKLMAKFFSKNIAGGILESSERAYTTPGNYLRYNLFSKMVNRMVGNVADEAAFLKAVDEIPYRDLKRVADTVNIITGRSTILRGKKGAQYAPALNALLFAPNYVISRGQLPFLPIQSVYNAVKTQGPSILANPKALWKSDPALQLQMRALGGFTAETVALLTAVKVAAEAGILPGFKVETDPRSRRFGKVQTPGGDIDMLGGYSQIIATAAQFVTGEQKDRRGVVKDVDPQKGFVGDRAHVIWDKFIRSKTAPWPGIAWDVTTGKTFTGETLSAEPDVLDSALRERLLPLAMQDLVDGYLQAGVKGAGFAAPALLGARISPSNTVGDVKDDVAEERFGKPFAELTVAQREEVNNHSKVLDKEREFDLSYGDSFTDAIGAIQLERSQTENKLFSDLATKTIGVKDFAKRVEAAQIRYHTAREKAAEQFGLKETPKTSMLDQALQEWYGLMDLADIGAEDGFKSGDIDFDKLEELRASLLKRLTPEQIKYIEDQQPADHDPSVNWYFNNKRYINDSGYYDIVDAEFSKSPAAKKFESYDRLVAARDYAIWTADKAEKARLSALIAPISKRATAKKELLRRKDPQLDAALVAIGRTTTTKSAAAARLLKQ